MTQSTGYRSNMDIFDVEGDPSEDGIIITYTYKRRPNGTTYMAETVITYPQKMLRELNKKNHYENGSIIRGRTDIR